VTELAASNTGRQRKVADRNLLIHKRVGEVILTLGHRTDENTNTVLGIRRFNPLTNLDKWCIEAQRNFAAVRRQVVSDGVLNHAKQLLVRVGGANRQAVQKLHHETGKTLERSGNADWGRDLNQDALGGMDIDLELAGLVDWGIQEGE
jgi:hypothetical protein